MNRKIDIEEIKLLLPDYITGTLGAAESDIVENAIKQNAEISKLFRDMKNALDFVNTVSFSEPSPRYWNNLLPRIHERIDQKEEKKFLKAIPLWWKVAIPVAAVILIFVIYRISHAPDEDFTQKKTEQVKESVSSEKRTTQNRADSTQIVINELNTTEKEMQNKEVQVNRRRKSGNTDEIKSETLEDQTGNQSSSDKLIEEIASIDAYDPFGLTESETTGVDEEMENEIERMSPREKDVLLEEISNSNL